MEPLLPLSLYLLLSLSFFSAVGVLHFRSYSADMDLPRSDSGIDLLCKALPPPLLLGAALHAFMLLYRCIQLSKQSV